MNSIIEWLEQHLGSCVYKKYFGIECPGCGMQRAFIELLKGNFVESLKLYPALLPTILMLITLVLHIIFKFRRGAYYIKLLFILNVVIIVTNYIIKQINYFQ